MSSRVCAVKFGALGRRILSSSSIRCSAVQSISNRNAHIVSYRSVAKPSAKAERGANIVATIMWWWILYHLFTDYHHIIGHFPYPNPEEWTNEELGVPDDDE